MGAGEEGSLTSGYDSAEALALVEHQLILLLNLGHVLFLVGILGRASKEWVTLRGLEPLSYILIISKSDALAFR